MPKVFFGGARGGGKTDGVLGKWALKERTYGRHFNARMFRKATTTSEDAIERAKEIYLPLGAKFNETKLTFRMPHGGRVSFGYLDGIGDADAEQGKNRTDAWVEEAGQHASPAAIDRLFGALRSAQGVPTQLILTANPGGAGQHWIAQRYRLIPFPAGPRIIERTLADGSPHQMGVIPSRITDNKILLEHDPGYKARLQWLEGFDAEPTEPLSGRPRADACGSCGGLRRLPVLDLPHQPLSTKRRQTGILVDVHPVLSPRALKLRNLSFLGPNRMDNLSKAHS